MVNIYWKLYEQLDGLDGDLLSRATPGHATTAITPVFQWLNGGPRRVLALSVSIFETILYSMFCMLCSGMGGSVAF